MMNSPEISDPCRDRRRRRSDEPEVALGYQLARVATDFDLECCVIVDESGHTVAEASELSSAINSEFANLLPTMSKLPEHRGRFIDQIRRHLPELSDDELSVCVFRAGGRRLFIGAVGPEAVMNEVAIFRAITGARRIHGF